MTDKIIHITPENEFLRPYIEREMGKSKPPFSVMVSSSDIYAPVDDKAINEDGDILADSKWVALERDFMEQNPGGIILRAAPIIGTCMTGKMRKLAEDIYRGRFFHFPGNDARKSVIHASDLATTVAYLAKNGVPDGEYLIFNVCGAGAPTLHDIAEALAYRMGDKRISNLSTGPQQFIGRILYGARYKDYTRNELFDGEEVRRVTGLEPVDVCEYLRNHVYDENSI